MSEPSEDWVRHCMAERGRVLTGLYAHYCQDWDCLTVDETTPNEFECCHCFDRDADGNRILPPGWGEK